MQLTIFQAYRVKTVARTVDLLFRGKSANGVRLWFTELDPPYGDVFLRPAQIKAFAPLDSNRALT